MKYKRYSVEQIVAAVKQHELGTPAGDITRRLGIAEQTFYRWKKQYGGLEPGEARELKQLRDENAKLKKLGADLSLDNDMLQDASRRRYVNIALTRIRYGYKRIHVLLRREGWHSTTSGYIDCIAWKACK